LQRYLAASYGGHHEEEEKPETNSPRTLREFVDDVAEGKEEEGKEGEGKEESKEEGKEE
jgi:hypothetical protein